MLKIKISQLFCYFFSGMMSLKLTSESLFAIGPIAKNIVFHLETKEFFACLQVCPAWKCDLNQAFLWNVAFSNSIRFLANGMTTAFIGKSKRTCYFLLFNYLKNVRLRESVLNDLPKSKSLQDIKLYTHLIASYQELEHQEFEPEDIHQLNDQMIKLWNDLEYPQILAKLAAKFRMLNFFKFYLELLEELPESFINIFPCVLFEAGNAKAWWIVAEMICKLPQDMKLKQDILLKTDCAQNNIFHCAARWGNSKIFKLLLSTIILPQYTLIKKNYLDHYTPLHFAAKEGHLKIVNMILNQVPLSLGALDMQDLYDRTPLHWASEKGHVEIAQILANKMSTEALVKPDASGQTALHFATRNSHVDIVKILVNKMPQEALAHLDINVEVTKLILSN